MRYLKIEFIYSYIPSTEDWFDNLKFYLVLFLKDKIKYNFIGAFDIIFQSK